MCRFDRTSISLVRVTRKIQMIGHGNILKSNNTKENNNKDSRKATLRVKHDLEIYFTQGQRDREGYKKVRLLMSE